MKQRITTFFAGGLLALTLFGFATAGQYEDGEAAYQRGDYATAIRLLRPLADKGNAWAQILLGDLSDKGQGVPQDYAKAAMWYRKAAEKGNADAQIRLAEMYYFGRGVPDAPQDYAKAAMWYRKAADKGNADAQIRLGEMYKNGKGVPQDFVQAHMWFNLAASTPCVSANGVVDPFCDVSGARAASSREEVATKMTPAQIAEAQRMASEWVPK